MHLAGSSYRARLVGTCTLVCLCLFNAAFAKNSDHTQVGHNISIGPTKRPAILPVSAAAYAYGAKWREMSQRSPAALRLKIVRRWPETLRCLAATCDWMKE